MLRKIIVGLLIGMLSISSVNAADKVIAYIGENAIGYQDAVQGLSFSPSLTDMVSKIGKVNAFDVAINKENNPDATVQNNSLNYKETKFDLRDISDNEVFSRDGVTLHSLNGVAYVRISTNVPFTTQTILTENYRVTYTIGNGYLYKVTVDTKYQEAKYKENFDQKQQQDYLTTRTQNYLSNNGYKSMSSWYNTNNKFIKDDMIVDVNTPEDDNRPERAPLNYFRVSVTNERLMQEYKTGKRTAYNSAVNKTFSDFDRIMK